MAEMELRQLEYFLAVVDEGTFTGAAAAVHVTQPSLSQGIRTLERELGVALFVRAGRGAVLSSAGEVLVDPARQAVRDAATARAAVAAVRGLTGGRLDLATLPTLAVHPLTVWVGRFASRYPGVEVHVVEPEEAPAIADLVRRGACELGLGELPAPDDVVATPLGEQAMVAVLPPDLDFGTAPVPIARLAGYPLVVTPKGTSTRDAVDAALAAAGVTARVAVETTHRQSLVPLVAQGAGLTFLPEGLAAEEAGRRHLTLAAPDPPIRRAVGVMYRRGALAPAAAAFLEIVRAHPATV